MEGTLTICLYWGKNFKFVSHKKHSPRLWHLPDDIEKHFNMELIIILKLHVPTFNLGK